MSVVVSKKWLRSSPLNNIYFCIIPRESLHVTALVSVAKLLFAVTPLIPVCRARSTYRTFDHLPDWRFNLPGAKMKRPISFWAEWRKPACTGTPPVHFGEMLPILLVTWKISSKFEIVHFSWEFWWIDIPRFFEILTNPSGCQVVTPSCALISWCLPKNSRVYKISANGTRLHKRDVKTIWKFKKCSIFRPGL